METKSSLRIYRQFKTEMREEDYGGGRESRLWFEARTDCMRLKNRRWGEEDRSCKLCGNEIENLRHFISDCRCLERKRKNGGGGATEAKNGR